MEGATFGVAAFCSRYFCALHFRRFIAVLEHFN